MCFCCQINKKNHVLEPFQHHFSTILAPPGVCVNNIWLSSYQKKLNFACRLSQLGKRSQIMGRNELYSLNKWSVQIKCPEGQQASNYHFFRFTRQKYGCFVSTLSFMAMRKNHGGGIRMYAALGCFFTSSALADETAQVGPKVIPNVLLYYEGTSSL